MLFLDDRVENVAAAAQLGIPSLVFDDMAKVSKEVEKVFDLPLPSEIEVSATRK